MAVFCLSLLYYNLGLVPVESDLGGQQRRSHNEYKFILLKTNDLRSGAAVWPLWIGRGTKERKAKREGSIPRKVFVFSCEEDKLSLLSFIEK